MLMFNSALTHVGLHTTVGDKLNLPVFNTIIQSLLNLEPRTFILYIPL